MRKTITSTFGTTACLLLLLACCLAAYWPLTLGMYSLKNDALNYFLPVRHLISESLSSGYWPYWTPYFNLGYPLHGDMQSGVWNPFVQIISLFGPYSIRTLQWETLLYVYLSGVGMCFLVKHFIADYRIVFLASVSFMLCGFNSDSAQFLNWISSASFLPFCFLFYYRTLTEAHWRPAILFALFYYLMFVTAYPADFIISAYIFLAMMVWWFFKKRNRTRQIFVAQLKLHLLASIAFALLALPAIISFTEFLQLSERGSGASYEDVMSNPFHPLLVLSYFTPLPVWKASFAAITDPLERNAFFGIITFAFLLLAFFIKTKDRLSGFLKWAFIISLVFSFGEFGLIRIAAYYLLPLMDSFRHPANAKLFTIFFGCLLAASALHAYHFTGVQKTHPVIMMLAALFTALLIWSLTGRISLFDISFSHIRFKQLLDQLTFSDLLLINLLIQIPFLIILFYFFSGRLSMRNLIVAAAVNSVLHTAMVQPFTVVKKDRVADVQQVLNAVQVNGYPRPDLAATLQQNSLAGDAYFDEIGVSNLYNKKIGRVEYRIGPSNLLHQNAFWFNQPLRNHFMHYPVFYRADTLVNTFDPARISQHKKILLWEHEAAPADYSPGAFIADVEKFTPNQWLIRVQSQSDGFYSLFQNHYPRWQLKIDDKPQNLYKVNVAFMGFQIPAGTHVVELSYYTTDLQIAFYVSTMTLLLLILLLIFYRTPERSAPFT